MLNELLHDWAKRTGCEQGKLSSGLISEEQLAWNALLTATAQGQPEASEFANARLRAIESSVQQL